MKCKKNTKGTNVDIIVTNKTPGSVTVNRDLIIIWLAHIKVYGGVNPLRLSDAHKGE